MKPNIVARDHSMRSAGEACVDGDGDGGSAAASAAIKAIALELASSLYCAALAPLLDIVRRKLTVKGGSGDAALAAVVVVVVGVVVVVLWVVCWMVLVRYGSAGLDGCARAQAAAGERQCECVRERGR